VISYARRGEIDRKRSLPISSGAAHQTIVSDFHQMPVNFNANISHAIKIAGENRRRGSRPNYRFSPVAETSL